MALPMSILILADQPVVAALLGMMVELAGFQPVFAATDELPTDAVKRLRPNVVVMIDLTLDESRSDLFFAHLAKRRIPVALFGPINRQAELSQTANSRGIPWFTLPPDTSRLSSVIELASRSAWWERASDRRRGVDPSQSTGEGFVFQDQQGHHWTVFDRRGGEDRRADAAASQDAKPIIERLFVNERGQRFSCEVSADEIADASMLMLEKQLARAVPV